MDYAIARYALVVQSEIVCFALILVCYGAKLKSSFWNTMEYLHRK